MLQLQPYGSRDSQHHRPSPAIETCWLSSSGHLILTVVFFLTV